MSDRIRCLVPHCRRSKQLTSECIEVVETGQSLDAAGEWICQTHWQLIPRADRILYFAARRKFRKHRTYRCGLVFTRLWRRCRKLAIEGAVGI